MESTLPLQAAVIAVLKASAPLTAIVGAKVYDRVPANTALPYVTITGWQDVNQDTDCLDASEAFFDVQCFSTAVGRPEAARMAGAVKAALNRTAYAGNAEILHRSTLYFTEGDGLTQRAVVNFHALVDGD